MLTQATVKREQLKQPKVESPLSSDAEEVEKDVDVEEFSDAEGVGGVSASSSMSDDVDEEGSKADVEDVEDVEEVIELIIFYYCND